MQVSADIILLAVMVIVALFLYGVIRGLLRHNITSRRSARKQHANELMTVVMQQEYEKKRQAERGDANKKSQVMDFKQNR